MAEPVVSQETEGAAQTGAEGSATTPTATAGTDPGNRPTLESRLAGLEARLAEQGRSKTAADKRAEAAEAKLAEYEAGKLTDNEAFQAELKRERDRAATAERTAQLARIEARYPETFGTLGESAAGLSEETLAGN